MSRTTPANFRAANQEGFKMNNKAAGASKKGNNTPRHAEHNQHGTEKKPFGSQPTKAELLARMKAAAAAKKVEK